MTRIATVITGADKALKPVFSKLAIELCQTDQISLISYPFIDLIIAKRAGVRVQRERQVVLLDVAYTKAHQARYGLHSDTCIIVTEIGAEKGTSAYDEARKIPELEREEIEKWRMFDTIFLTYRTPDRKIWRIK